MTTSPPLHSEEAEFQTLMTFRRYFSTYPEPAFRKSFPGRLETISFGDDVFDAAVARIRDAMNEANDSNRFNIKPADGMTGIHLDYVESKESNALAFYVDDLACVAITNRAIETVITIAKRLALSSEIKRLLGVPVASNISELVGLFFVKIMEVISNHEIGHIFHGHCIETARALPFLEARDSDAPCFSDNIENSMRRQAMEVEADGYGVHMLLNNLFDEKAAAALMTYAGTELSREEFLLTLALIAYGGMFYLWAAKSFDKDRVEHCEHPFGLMRMNVIMTDMNGWCEQHRPGLERWGDLKRFQAIMEAVASTGARTVSRDVWSQQGVFLISPEGEAYRDRLYAKQRIVREQMKPHRWYLLSEQQ